MGISVLMSVYAKENPEYFKTALESVINQTLQPDEIVIMKDGPLTEELEAVIVGVQKQLDAKRQALCTEGQEHIGNCDRNRTVPVLRTFQFPQNVQLGRALKKGVELCEHELIARMDTDDIACPDRLEKQYAYMMEHTQTAVLGGYIEEFCDENGFSNVKAMPVGFENLRSYARFRNPLNHMTVMLRRDAILAAGSYRHYPFLEDYDLWSRVIAAGYKIDNVPEVLVRARVGNELYGRRGGLDYCKRYLRLRREQKRLGLTNAVEHLVACVITIAVTVIPSGARKEVYQRVLRK